MALYDDPRLSEELLDAVNARVRLLPWTSEERRDLARAAGVTVRQVNLWLAPPDAAQQRPMIPASLFLGVDFARLNPGLSARLEAGIDALPRAERERLVAPVLTQRVTARSGYEHGFTEVFPSLKEALDRLRQFETGKRMDPYMRRFWKRAEVVLSPEGKWSIEGVIRSGVKSPPTMTSAEFLGLTEEEIEDYDEE